MLLAGAEQASQLLSAVYARTHDDSTLHGHAVPSTDAVNTMASILLKLPGMQLIKSDLFTGLLLSMLKVVGKPLDAGLGAAVPPYLIVFRAVLGLAGAASILIWSGFATRCCQHAYSWLPSASAHSLQQKSASKLLINDSDALMCLYFAVMAPCSLHGAITVRG